MGWSCQSPTCTTLGIFLAPRRAINVRGGLIREDLATNTLFVLQSYDHSLSFVSASSSTMHHATECVLRADQSKPLCHKLSASSLAFSFNCRLTFFRPLEICWMRMRVCSLCWDSSEWFQGCCCRWTAVHIVLTGRFLPIDVAPPTLLIPYHSITVVLMSWHQGWPYQPSPGFSCSFVCVASRN